MKWKIVSKIMLSILFIGSIAFEPSVKIYADQQLSKQPLIYTGESFSGVINSDGSIWSWRDNRYGQLGRGEKSTRREPVPKLANKMELNIVQVSTTVDSTYALSSEGEILAWGYNYDLGNGSLDLGYIPSPVLIKRDQKLTDIILVDGGEHYGTAVRKDGTVWSWGVDSYGQLGVGASKLRQKIYASQVKGPGDVGYLKNIVSVSAGRNHTVAIDEDGTIWTWGKNSFGELGKPDILSSNIPVHLSDAFNQVKAVSAGSSFTIALKSDGTVWGWGNNSYGQFGDGTLQDSYTPVQVKGPTGEGFLDQIVAIRSGGSHTLALRVDGTVWSWGGNYSGQLGVPSASSKGSNIPVQIEFKDDFGRFIEIQSLDAFSDHNIALSTDKQLFTWGGNSKGNLGVGDTKSRLAPVKVDWRDSIVDVKPVYNTSYIYDANGRVLRKTISQKEGPTLYTYQYIYDFNGNLKNIQIVQP
ncbi:RCC1 domain-containing protein [Paenibacillus sp. OK003]|uniref:RCC1 domain-containing protein n=1 Tax=Paenibacillus sp. OK003 TaxID=1884380 RepID=UPI0008C84002|nr:RCC1 domain-containing protein [Paenibacillus sp. OK003]SEL27203.1 Alpha-tubulin suppressor [Paenibacillus sp. OK003]